MMGTNADILTEASSGEAASDEKKKKRKGEIFLPLLPSLTSCPL